VRMKTVAVLAFRRFIPSVRLFLHSNAGVVRMVSNVHSRDPVCYMEVLLVTCPQSQCVTCIVLNAKFAHVPARFTLPFPVCVSPSLFLCAQ
jgi:hypothetical protein